MRPVSIIITAFSEPETVASLVEQIERQVEKLSNFSVKEILLVCPDKGTAAAGLEKDHLSLVRHLEDQNRGKPAALNLAFQKARSEFLVLTDGDVVWEKGALKNILVPLRQEKVGLVSSRPISANLRTNLFGFWSWFLTDAAHCQRIKRAFKNQYLDVSGYLLAVKRKLVSPMPENILADDAWLSRRIWAQGYQIDYVPEAKVRVRFPTNFSDWIAQKKRTTGGQLQLEGMQASVNQMRGFFQEVRGLRLVLIYPRNNKEFVWTLLLILARLYVWFSVFLDRKILKKAYCGKWKRIESTK